MLKNKKTVKIRGALLDWYDSEKRDLPWRQTRDPYSIWVSEIMLQQTQVQTVIPYYRRWMRAFPTLRRLAKAPEEKVLKLWEGLGYYSRARNLKKAAQKIQQDFNGVVPENYQDILSLPGIGKYTAGAILSIAHDQPLPVLDGNVKRVLARLFALKENGASGRSEKRLWQVAEDFLPDTRPGDFNQAVMELGATVCLPKNPMCPLCPLKKYCVAKNLGDPEKFPPPKPRTPAKKIEVSAAVLQRGKKIFIQQRLHDGLMGGLWEFPGGKRGKNETPEDCLVREIREELGIDIRISEKLMVIKHSYTRFRVTLHVFRVRLGAGRLKPTQCEQWQWVNHEELNSYTFPAANGKIVKYLTQNRRV